MYIFLHGQKVTLNHQLELDWIRCGIHKCRLRFRRTEHPGLTQVQHRVQQIAKFYGSSPFLPLCGGYSDHVTSTGR